MYQIKDCEEKARIGELYTRHGKIETPFFMPVATYGVVKGVTYDKLEEFGYKAIISNIFHLFLRPGIEFIKKSGGIHKITGWKHVIVTDSGGYQAYRFQKRRGICKQGILFKSPIDGQSIMFTPEATVFYQKEIGSDIIHPLDDCRYSLENSEEIHNAIKNTIEWAKISKNVELDNGQLLFLIIQGGIDHNLRKICAEELISFEPDGFSIGGLAVGENEQIRYEVVELLTSILPSDKPRYLMGIGLPHEIVKGISLGIDMFDSVVPTRNARNGQIFTFRGIIKIKQNRFKGVDLPPDTECNCYTCKTYSLGFLRHLFMAKDLMATVLLSIHNLYFYNKLIDTVKKLIKEKRLHHEKNRLLEILQKEYN